MTNNDDYRYNNDDGFSGYEITSVDPGSWILIATISFCAALYGALPCVLSYYHNARPKRTRHMKRRNASMHIISESRDEDPCHTSTSEEVTTTQDSPSPLVHVAAVSSHSQPQPSCYMTGEENRNRDDEDDQSVVSMHSIVPSIVNKVLECRYRATGRTQGYRGNAAPQKPTHRLCSNRFQSPFLARNYYKLLSIIDFDDETRKIYGLALPYFAQAVVSAVSWNVLLIVIGQLLGTRDVAAYSVVCLLTGLTSSAIGGIYSSLMTILGFSRGTENHKLTGEYVQLAIIFYSLLSFIFIIIWSVSIKDVILLLGFDDKTAVIAKSFAIPYLWSQLLSGQTSCLHCILDVYDRQMISTLIITATEVVHTASVVIAAIYWNPTLQTIGIIFAVIDGLQLIVTMILVSVTGWFQPFYCGLLQSCAFKNVTAMKTLAKTALPIMAGYVLTYGEWEILAIFAGFLGPAEVAAWSMLSTLWGSVEVMTFAIGDASEVRVSYLLGSGQPKAARDSAFKSICIAFVFSLTVTSILFIMSDSIPRWLTTDQVLQAIIAEIIPILGIGNISMTMGSMAWTLVGAQNRYRLSTAIGITGSWCVTIPLASIFSIVYRINLQGQTAAVVIGYMMSGFVTTVILLRSDWKKLSDQVIQDNSTKFCSIIDPANTLPIDMHSDPDSITSSSRRALDRSTSSYASDVELTASSSRLP